MGFDFDKSQEDKAKQMSLFDFKMPQETFSEGTSCSNAIDYNAWILAREPAPEPKTTRFLGLSAAVHAAAILFIAVVSVPLVEDIKTETITIELEDTPQSQIAARGFEVPRTQGATAAVEPLPVVDKVHEVGAPPEELAKELPMKEIVPNKTVSAKVPTKLPNKIVTQELPAKAAAAPAPAMAKTNFQAVPMTVDDIDAPALDEGAFSEAKATGKFNEDLSDDFAHIDQSQKNLIEDEQKNIEAMTASLADEQDENLKDIAAQNEAERQQLEALQERVRQKDAKAIASTLAAENAAALKKARAEAVQAEALKKSGVGSEGQGLATNKGFGAGNSGVQNVPAQQISGMPQGVRSLDQLRQMPGNPRPAYSRDERRRGDQGEIIFVAYISKDGYPSQFRMLRSTSHRNLDGKTLLALKKWRFYPGQEGWVELPFRWDLKGGVQEDGGLLRRSVSRR